MGVGKNYHPELDTKQKIQDIRAEWEEREAARTASDSESGHYDDDDSDFTAQVDNYFRGKPAPTTGPMSEKIGRGGSSGTNTSNSNGKSTEKNTSQDGHSAPGSSRGGNMGAADDNLNEKQPE